MGAGGATSRCACRKPCSSASTVGSRERREISRERIESLTSSIGVLTTYFKKWTAVFPNHSTGSDSLKVYLEALGGSDGFTN